MCVYLCEKPDESAEDKLCMSRYITIQISTKDIDLKVHKSLLVYCKKLSTFAYSQAKDYCEMINCGAPDASKTIHFS